MTTDIHAGLVSPGSVVDTTTDPGWTPVRVTVTLADPIVGIPRDPMHLDGPVSRAAFLAASSRGLRLPPMGEWVHDFQLPFATWTAPCTRSDPDPRLLAADGQSVWGWACSAAHYTVLRHIVAYVRRRPALEEMARWCTDRKHHISLGPRRAANIPNQGAWVQTITWWALADKPRLEKLLTRLTHLGRMARHGWGRILTTKVEEDPKAVHLWRLRDMPDPAGQIATIRAPYWHRSREMLCSSIRHA